ncbi:uncharacterized protein LOC116195235 [Punica granatum]|uniref:Uncharacterized protein LOC116195235 n=2 Tax=Punica granatum TaxID=22663 RepID=A0A6P8CHB4_PUNGR|nr:uncharacterized protein LOC116195235 [Punica granatum]PKI34945.1 hypothetical protein CRG98_044651 [Punica granatum]
MANPRRSSYSAPQATISLESAMPSSTFAQRNSLFSSSSVIHFLKKPHAIPFLLSVFLLLTWISLRLQSSSSRFSSPPHLRDSAIKWSREDDSKANLVRFPASKLVKDKRGWLVNPVSLALDSGIAGGAVSCASVHVGEIRPGGVRANHRHHTCNETFVIWGAKTKFRLEKGDVVDKAYAEVVVGADEVAVAASPRGTAHALVNVDPIRTTFFLGCQDSIVNYSSSGTDFNVWKDL